MAATVVKPTEQTTIPLSELSSKVCSENQCHPDTLHNCVKSRI